MKRLLMLTGLFVGAALAGCAGGGNSLPPQAEVSGTVNLDGKSMPEGEVRFEVAGYPAKSLPIKNGAFSGEVTPGKNRVEVVWEKDGPPNPMDPTVKLKVNVVAGKFAGPNTSLSADIPAGGKTDLKFEVTSARK